MIWVPCPNCSGTGRVDGQPCRNCMDTRPGFTYQLPDGTACVHRLTERKVGRCIYEYTCSRCSIRFTVDSSD